ncbi:LOW QUALITY PROTEIN: serum response factor-like [Pomacea canaliculata]|uniref:LOW QUALITY PROTEIN: serum response factor-like n=1 Tax=Pomacea canaliculata TaxID=400727 RepID=UPI000D72CD74|nr:LOW QUALITY PROTEIN: serum response factor-like [Pomacea canaliculata]
MQTSNHSGAVTTVSDLNSATGLNGCSGFATANGPGVTHVPPDNFIFEQVDPTRSDGDDDSDSELPTGHCGQGQQSTPTSGLKPGKKTKGRVKIKMEFIENKLRRYTTFSKRKTGIMKKAYELSTLTGTQVMLLVASETGHVYTFATRKLQPMITSDSGKALIQTCLNSPDPPPGSSAHTTQEQRMNPSGFEETELTYSVGEDDSKMATATLQSSLDSQSQTPPATHVPVYTVQQQAVGGSSSASHVVPISTTVPQLTAYASQPITVAAPPVVTAPATGESGGGGGGGKVTGIPLQLPGLILQTGSGQPLTFSPGQLSVSTSTTQPQTVYRTVSGQLVTAMTNQPITTAASETSSVATPSTLSFLSSAGTTAVTPSQIIMYQTPQGVVYATPTPSATLGDRTIFNFQQPATAISIPQSESGGQQIITIPVPVSLANSQQVLQLSTVPPGETIMSDMSGHVTPSKKSRK